MNTINKWALGMAFVMGLASCEMKEEIWGNDPISGDTGLLDLNIATTSSKNQISTKGTTDQVEEFPVTITGKDVDYNLSFASFAKLKEENPLTLPVGTFTIEAHSPGEFEDVMTEPYYGGTKEITIAKSTTTQDSISCTIQNVKISLDLTSSFLETYGEWEITVTDNNGHVKVYKNTDEDAEEPASIYWKLGDDVEIIYIKGSATTKDGQEKVTINSSAKKTDLQEYEDGESTSFVGGDELVLSFTPVKVEGSTPGVEKDGIERDMAVVDENGLVGKVIETSSGSSVVRLVSSNHEHNKIAVSVKVGENIYNGISVCSFFEHTEEDCKNIITENLYMS